MKTLEKLNQIIDKRLSNFTQYGTISGTATNGVVSVKLDGASTAVKARYLSTYTPADTDRVVITKINGSNKGFVIIGKLG